MDIYSIIKKPLLTEKGTLIKEKGNYYAFEVDRKANKTEIKNAIEKIFNVHVEKINTVTKNTKVRRFGRYLSKPKKIKKAYVKLKQGEKIEIVEGV